MQTNEWYYECKGTRIGPVSTSDLKRLRVEGILKGETLVWADGMEDWCPAGTVDSLKEILAVALPPAVGVTDSGISASRQDASKVPFVSGLKPQQRLLLFASAGVLVLCILGAAGYFLMVRRAPHQGMSSEDHFEALVEKYKELRTTMGYSVVRAGKGVCPDNDDLFLQVISTDPEYQQEAAAVMLDMKLESLPEDDSLESIRVRSMVQKEVRLRLARKEREILSAKMEPHKAASAVSRMLGGDLELRNALMADLPPLPKRPNPFTQPTMIAKSSPNPKATGSQPFVPAPAGQAQSPSDASLEQRPANPAVAPPAVLPAAGRTTDVPVGSDNPVVPQEPEHHAQDSAPATRAPEPVKVNTGSGSAQPSWDHLDLVNARVMGEFLRNQVPAESLPTLALSTKEPFSGPLEITAAARTDGKDIRLFAYGSALLIFNWKGNPRQLRVHRPDAQDWNKGSIATAPVEPLKPGQWYMLKWRITGEQMEVFVDDLRVFEERRQYDLSTAQPIRISGAQGSTVDIKALEVKDLDAAGTEQEDRSTNTKNARAFLSLANQFAKAGQTEQANAYARKVIEVAPDSPEAREARTMLGLKEPTPPESAETRPNPPSGEQKPVQTPAVEEKRLTAADIPGVYNVYQDGKQIGTMELFSNGGIRNWKGWKKAEYKWSLDGTTIIMRWAKTRSAFDYTGSGKFADTTGDTKGVSIEKQK